MTRCQCHVLDSSHTLQITANEVNLDYDMSRMTLTFLAISLARVSPEKALALFCSKEQKNMS